MFNQIKEELIKILKDNPRISRTDLLDIGVELGLSKSKTAKQSLGRTLNAIIREGGAEPIGRKKNKVITYSDDGVVIEDKIKFIPPPDKKQWRRKLLKTGQTTNPKWKTSTNIEIYTFIDDEDDKFNNDLSEELFNGILTEIPDMAEIDEAGYSDNLIDEFDVDKLYVYPSSNLIINGKSKEVTLK